MATGAPVAAGEVSNPSNRTMAMSWVYSAIRTRSSTGASSRPLSGKATRTWGSPDADGTDSSGEQHRRALLRGDSRGRLGGDADDPAGGQIVLGVEHLGIGVGDDPPVDRAAVLAVGERLQPVT